MRIFFFFFLVISSIALQNARAELQLEDSTLLKVVSVIRHGTRYAESSKLADAEDIKYQGELTPVGMRQHNELGRAYYQLFAEELKFISPTFEPSELYVQSTDKNRTIQSAQSFLHGLYSQTATINDKVNSKYFHPPFSPQVLSNSTQPDGRISVGSGIQPIPIRTLPASLDKYLLTHGSACKAALRWREENMKSKEWKQVTEYYKPTMIQIETKIKDYIKTELPQPLDLFQVYQWMDAILCQYQKGGNNYPIIEDSLFQTMQEISYIQFFMVFFLKEYQLRAISSPFYSDLLVHLDNNLNKKSTHKMVLFFAHDTTINMILNSLGLTGYDCLRKKFIDKTWDDSKMCISYIAPVASNIIFELRKNNSDGQVFIAIRYNGNYLPFNEAKDTMLYTQFKKRFTEYQIQNWNEVCETGDEDHINTAYIPQWVYALIVIFAVLLVVASFIAFFLFKKMKELLNPVEEKHIELQENV